MKGNSSNAQVFISQGSKESATRHAKALWEEKRRQYFLRTCEQVRKRKIKTQPHPFDLRKGRKPRPTQALLKALYEETPLNAKDLAILFDVSANTILTWLRQCEIEIRREGKVHIINKKNFRRRKLVDGIPHKLCSGPSHDKPIFLPFSHFYKNYTPEHSADGLAGSCKRCESFRAGHKPMVPYKKVEFAIVELVNRLGVNETCRRIPVGSTTLWKMRHKRTKFVHRATAERILGALALVRANGDARHTDSIHHGAAQRNRPEKIPSRQRDFYRKQSDVETEQRQGLRRSAAAQL